MFGKNSKTGCNDPLKGIRQKTLVYGERTLMAEFLLSKNSALPMHSHPYEQTGYLVKGHILLKVGDAQQDTYPGDLWCIPPDVIHGDEIIEDSIAIEIFSPPREDYIPKNNPQ